MVAKAAGGFLGGLFNNPGALIGLIALGGLLIFRKDITNFFQKGFDSIGESFGKVDVNLGDINLPGLPEIKFPDFSNIFQGFQDQLSSIAGKTVDGITIPGDTTVNPDGTVSSSTGPTFSLSDFEKQEALNQLELNRLRSQLENALFDIPASEDISGAEFTKAINEAEFRARQQDPIAAIVENMNVQTQLDTGQQFQGGGPSFIGGSINETPIHLLSLGQIIDRFNVSASAAADIRARSTPGFFDDFDFGTNTGSGIGTAGVIQNIGSVSDSQFQGLSAQEIALRLTGGNISNF